MSEATYAGGCQCGAIRFRVSGVRDSAVCHCRMCQKAFGNYFAPLVTVEAVEWTRGEPALFRSSNLARRGFCARCGTPLFYLGDDDLYEIAAGAFDDPGAVPPTRQFDKHGHWPFLDTLLDLPEPEPSAVATFQARVVNHQHPDRDTVTWPSGEYRS
jgi:hypothetical protein